MIEVAAKSKRALGTDNASCDSGDYAKIARFIMPSENDRLAGLIRDLCYRLFFADLSSGEIVREFQRFVRENNLG